MLKGKGKAFKPSMKSRPPPRPQQSQSSASSFSSLTSSKRKEREEDHTQPPIAKRTQATPDSHLTSGDVSLQQAIPDIIQQHDPAPDVVEQPLSTVERSHSIQETQDDDHPETESSSAQPRLGVTAESGPPGGDNDSNSTRLPEVTQNLHATTEKEPHILQDQQQERTSDIPSISDEQPQPSQVLPSAQHVAQRPFSGSASIGLAEDGVTLSGGVAGVSDMIIHGRDGTSPLTGPPRTIGAVTASGGNTGLGGAGDVGAAIGSSQIARVSEIVPMAALNPDGTSGGIIEEPASGAEKAKKKKVVRRKKVQTAQDGDDVRATVEMQLNRPRRVTGGKKSRKKKDGEKSKKKRAMTPEGAEDEIVDHSTLTMSDLCKDLRIGKKFSKHEEIKQRIVQKKLTAAKEKMAKEHPELISLIEGEENPPAAEGTPGDGAEPNEPVLALGGSGPQMRIVDGHIVMDESSLQVDRHKRAAAQEGAMEEIEENDFTRITTSGTFMKMERAIPWDAAAERMFYKGLRMFGTDFEMIAKMFPYRNRRQIKLKFNKEERNNPAKINRAMMGEMPGIDMEEFESISGLRLEEVADIEAERLRIEAEQNAEENRVAGEIAEANRRKKEAIHQSTGGNSATARALSRGDDDEPGGSSAKENAEPNPSKSREASAAPKSKKKGASKKAAKNKHSHRGGGEDVEVFGDA